MRLLVVWAAAVALSCALVAAGDAAEENRVSGGRIHAGEPRGPAGRRAEEEEEEDDGVVRMSDEPVEVAEEEEEKKKPKKKKTPEEIEAGKKEPPCERGRRRFECKRFSLTFDLDGEKGCN